MPLFDEGGQNNFKIIFDEKSGLFWTCSTIVPEPYQPLSPLADRGFSGTPANMRRILMLNYSIECDRSSARLLRPGLW